MIKQSIVQPALQAGKRCGGRVVGQKLTHYRGARSLPDGGGWAYVGDNRFG